MEQYAEWMKGLMTTLPDGAYELKSFATDSERKTVSAYAVFSGTHTGGGGPCPPTGKSLSSDYVYVMEFAGDKICHMTKIWNSGLAMKELGWV
jgi:predicted ester cyclase